MRAIHVPFVVTLIIVSVVSLQPVAAQQGDGFGRGANENELQLRVYEVGDLVMEIKDYPYPGSEFGTNKNRAAGGGDFGGRGGGFGGGGGGGGGGGVFQFGGGEGRPSATATKTTMNDLIDVIISVVATDTWAENGGSEAEARPFGNSLVVSQTPAVHQQIAQLLDQLRAGSGERNTVAVDARWLLLTSDELDQLVTTDESGVVALSRERLAEFTQRPTTIRGRTSCFSGQLVYVVSGTKRNVVSGYIPVVGSLEDGNSAAQVARMMGGAAIRLVAESAPSRERREPNVGYQPIVEKPNVGALLEIRPTLVQGGKAAIVDLKSTVTVSTQSASDGQQAATPGPPEVDRVAIQSQELATTLRVPLGEPVLVGGMTNEPDLALESEESPQLYLVLEVR